MKSNPNILQIPLPGGSGNAPTGAVQFQSDWPGLFVRGDHAIKLRSAIRELQQRFAEHEDIPVSNAIHDLAEIADVIEREIMTRDHVPTLKPLS